MRILYLVPYTPTPIRTRPYNLIRSLTGRGHEVTVFTLWSDAQERADAEALRAHCQRVVAAPLPRWRSLGNCLRALPTPTPLQAVYCWQPALARLLEEATRTTDYDIVHVEHLRGARYGLSLPSAVSVVWDSVDCISYLFEQAAHDSRSLFGRWMTRLELPRTRRYEGWLVHRFARVLVTSEVDRQALLRLSRQGDKERGRGGDARSITVLPNGVDLAYFTPGDEQREVETLVFSGKMSYHANITAALHLVHDIMPLIWQQRPGVQLWIVGKDPPGEVRALEMAGCGPGAPRQRVRVTGTVPDLRPYLRRATVAVAPVRYGAGIQNKVLEAMACGAPVVVSPQAVAALAVVDGEHALVADGPGAFAQAVLRLLDDAALRARLGAAGRAYVQAHHDWGAIAARLEGVYQETIAMRSAQGVLVPGEAS